VDDLEAMKDEFYQFCGWDVKTGVPLAERLEALDIGWVQKYIPH
jgi:aldehyde:ferredoxin oxidoreductase